MTGGINFKANERDRCENGGMQSEREHDKKYDKKIKIALDFSRDVVYILKQFSPMGGVG